jgi:hypothetical protein
MKFTAGSICLTCDASYKKAGWLIPKYLLLHVFLCLLF